MQSKYIKNNNNGSHIIEITIAKLYCLSLPLRMFSQLSFLQNIFWGCAKHLPFIFHIIGLLLWLVNEGGKPRCEGKEKLAGQAIKLVIWLNISSIIMAVVIQAIYGNHGSENAFQGIAGMLVYFTQYLFMFLYNYRVFQLLSIDELNKLLHIDCLILLVIGYMQVLVMNGIGAGIYDRINVLGITFPSTYLSKLCLTASEGANAGSLICIFVFPYLFSNILMGRRIYIIEFILWLIPLYYTYSATAYILCTVCTGVFVFLLIMRSNNPGKGFTTLLISLFVVGGFLLILLRTGVLNDERVAEIRYLLLEKATDTTGNGSTAARTVPFLVNWGAFKEYPLLGVGNGLQGYFYEKYFPDWALKVQGSDVSIFLARSKEGISNSGLFIPGLLSGYGIVGCFAIGIFIWNCIKENKAIGFFTENFYYMYILAGVSFFVMGLQCDAWGLYYAWFMLSIPFMTLHKETIS